jgi:type II secretory pathway pseudopilin PulG
VDNDSSQRGDTLVELLVALVVIGLTAIALLSGFGASISATSEYRNLSGLDTVLKSFVESATYQLGLQPQPPTTSSINPQFTPCATVTTYTQPATLPSPNPPPTPLAMTQGPYSATITNIEYLTSSNSWSPLLSDCNVGQKPSQQELLTATAKNKNNGQTESMQFAVADPAYNPPAATAAPQFTSAATDTVAAGGASSTFGVTTTGTPLPQLSANGISPKCSFVTFKDLGDGNGTLFINNPPANGVSTCSFTLIANNFVGSPVQQSFTLHLTSAPVFTSPATDTVPPGTPFTFTVTTSGFPVATLSAGGLPIGTKFTDNGDGTGTLSGNLPTGTYSGITFGALNSAGTTTQSFVLTVSTATPPAITSNPSFTTPANQSFSFTVVATGAPVPALSSSALPASVSFKDNGDGTGSLSGTNAIAAGTYPITFTATNSGGQTTQSFTLSVTGAVNPTVSFPTNANPEKAKQNKTVTFTMTGTNFKSGLTVTWNGPGSVGYVFLNSGQISITVTTPKSTGNFYTFTVTNPDGGTVTTESQSFVTTS